LDACALGILCGRVSLMLKHLKYSAALMAALAAAVIDEEKSTLLSSCNSYYFALKTIIKIKTLKDSRFMLQ
jgi:hypothetical protein